MISFALLGVAILLAFADWIAVYKNWKKAEYILKPAVMLCILAWMGLEGGFTGWIAWFALGILFSLIGDILLLLPYNLFGAGLAAFSLGHVAYIIGFNPTLPPINPTSLVLAFMVTLVSSQIYRRLLASIRSTGSTQWIRPVFAYVVVIALMALSALLTLVRTDWQPTPAILVSAGAILYMISDTLLAWNKFIAPVNISRVTSMATYHLGQIMIALGAMLHYKS